MIEVTARYKNGVQFEVEARGHKVLCDQPAGNGGEDTGMTPPEFLVAALASCAAFYAVAYLKKKNLPREGVVVRTVADKAAAPARLDNFRIEVEIPTELSEADRAGVDDAVHRCLIHNTMLHAPSIAIDVRTAVVL